MSVIFVAKEGKKKIIQSQNNQFCEEDLKLDCIQASSISSTHSTTDTNELVMMMVRNSPITTVSSCGAVEDYDENLSLRHTETPLNDDDECASVVSGNSAKTVLSPPSRNRGNALFEKTSKNGLDLNSQKNISMNKDNHLKSPLRNGAQTTSSFANNVETRTATSRTLRKRASKSPDSSAAEENYEGINFKFFF